MILNWYLVADCNGCLGVTIYSGFWVAELNLFKGSIWVWLSSDWAILTSIGIALLVFWEISCKCSFKDAKSNSTLELNVSSGFNPNGFSGEPGCSSLPGKLDNLKVLIL